MSEHEHDEKFQHRVIGLLVRIEHRLTQLVFGVPARSIEIKFEGGKPMSIQQGKTGLFSLSTIPVNSVLKQGNVPVWSADDPNVVLTPAADGMSVAAAVPASDTASTFNLSASAVSVDANGADLPLSTSVPVAITLQPPPPPVFATGLAIQQTS
jgi:hypothetical protein